MTLMQEKHKHCHARKFHLDNFAKRKKQCESYKLTTLKNWTSLSMGMKIKKINKWNKLAIDKCKKLAMNNYKNLIVLELGANDAIIDLLLGYISA